MTTGTYRGPGGGGPRGPGGPGGRPGGEPFPAPSEAELRAIVEEGDAQTLVEVAERIGRALARDLTTSQIRSVFGAVRQIEMNWPLDTADGDTAAERARRSQRDLILLKPKLAYQARRATSRGVENLRRVLDPAIDWVGADRDRFQNFADFFEAILAYHRASGGQ